MFRKSFQVRRELGCSSEFKGRHRVVWLIGWYNLGQWLGCAGLVGSRELDMHCSSRRFLSRESPGQSS